MNRFLVLPALVIAIALSACGNKGPLVLPPPPPSDAPVDASTQAPPVTTQDTPPADPVATPTPAVDVPATDAPTPAEPLPPDNQE